MSYEATILILIFVFIPIVLYGSDCRTPNYLTDYIRKKLGIWKATKNKLYLNKNKLYLNKLTKEKEWRVLQCFLS